MDNENQNQQQGQQQNNQALGKFAYYIHLFEILSNPVMLTWFAIKLTLLAGLVVGFAHSGSALFLFGIVVVLLLNSEKNKTTTILTNLEIARLILQSRVHMELLGHIRDLSVNTSQRMDQLTVAMGNDCLFTKQKNDEEVDTDEDEEEDDDVSGLN